MKGDPYICIKDIGPNVHIGQTVYFEIRDLNETRVQVRSHLSSGWYSINKKDLSKTLAKHYKKL